MTIEERIVDLLKFLYGSESGWIWEKLNTRINRYRKEISFDESTLEKSPRRVVGQLDEKYTILITYGDQFIEENRPPLRTLIDFLDEYLHDVISGVHILPFYPYSSDDGFSVIDYRQVDPGLGSWEDVNALSLKYDLMVDAVINHVSRESEWFRSFLINKEPYADFFIALDPSIDLSMVVRPRASSLLSEVQTSSGVRHVWTTFGEDQIDLNYANPDVLLEILDLLLYYAAQGARILRLDAIAYLWKEAGTPCIHLPQTHAVVKLMRAVLDLAAPHVLLITETNVPHEENISYFGEVDPETGRTDEAQLVYQFPLAPLVVNAFQQGNAEILSEWAANLETPAPFFNFLASHDGIGVMPARGLLTEAEIQALVDQTLQHGGQVSYRSNPDGSRSVYELNITFYDILNDPGSPSPETDLKRFLASQAIMLSLAGVPGIYVHSLFGSRNCYSCFQESSRARSINREKFHAHAQKDHLADFYSHSRRVFDGYCLLLSLRRSMPAFHPDGGQQVLSLNRAVFALLREAPSGDEFTVCLVNVSNEKQIIQFIPGESGLGDIQNWTDVLTGDKVRIGPFGRIELVMDGYQVIWLSPASHS